MKSGKDGIPRVLRPLVQLLRGTTTDKRVALTITRSFELIYGETTLDLSPIVSPITHPIPTEFLEQFNV